MNESQNFSHSMFGNLEILIKDGKEYFPATEVAKALGYSKPHDAITRHCKKDGWAIHPVIDSLGRKQEKKFINEGNLYCLIVKSKLPQAEQFETWVFEEVLPMIRKTGGYVNNDELFVNTYLAHADETTKLLFKSTLETVRKQNEKIAVLEPKAEYHDNVLDSKNSFTITEIAHDLNMTARKLNSLLNQLRIQRKVGATWVLYAEHQNKGYIDTKIYLHDNSVGSNISYNLVILNNFTLFVF
ncbi:phage antirepressor [Bacillus tropicus]|uniref:phage antirepressor n=1 Tax=Bacillus tropicus TaxID=2026188 RepID=UPI001CFE283C|nr:phage antirepressor KilAC domain-containing protein [Bacillus tropicus]